MTYLYVAIGVLIFTVLAGLDARRSIIEAAHEVLPDFSPKFGWTLPILGLAWIVTHLGIFRRLTGRPEHLMVGYLSSQIFHTSMPLSKKREAIEQLRKNLDVCDLEIHIS